MTKVKQAKSAKLPKVAPPYVTRHRVLESLADDIISNGVDIDPKDIEKLIDIYVRIIITATDPDGCDNTKPIDQCIDPGAVIDLININEDGIESLRTFALSFNDDRPDMPAGNFVNKLRSKTVEAISGSDVAIVTILRQIQTFMHIIQGMGKQFCASTSRLPGAVYSVYSCTKNGHMSIEAYRSSKGVAFKYDNTCLISFNILS